MNPSERFGASYFREESSYAALGGPARATFLMERWYGGLFRYVFRRWRRYLPQSGKAIDVGCAYGGCLRLLRTTGFHAFGTDVSDFAVEVAARTARPLGGVVVSDIQVERPFAGTEFDLALCFEVLEHLEDPAKGIVNIADCLQSGGVAWFTTPNPHFKIPPFDPWRDPTHISVLPAREWVYMLKDHGLQPLVVRSFLHIPVLYRFAESLSLVIPTGRWGPSFLILARKPEASTQTTLATLK